MKLAVSLIICLSCAVVAFSQAGSGTFQDRNISPRLCLPDSARYEIVSLEPSINLSERKIKLDRYTGKSFFYYSNERRWYPLDVRGGLPNERGNTKPKYQIYDDPDVVFLINNETGQSWALRLRTWEPVID